MTNIGAITLLAVIPILLLMGIVIFLAKALMESKTKPSADEAEEQRVRQAHRIRVAWETFLEEVRKFDGTIRLSQPKNGYSYPVEIMKAGIRSVERINLDISHHSSKTTTY